MVEIGHMVGLAVSVSSTATRTMLSHIKSSTFMFHMVFLLKTGCSNFAISSMYSFLVLGVVGAKNRCVWPKSAHLLLFASA